MKPLYSFLFLLFSLYSTVALAQVPRAINYQAVARDGSGNVMANKNIALKFSILNGSAVGTVDYAETHSLQTNGLGLFSVNIGQGSPVNGNMTNVNWGNTAKFLKVEIDPNGGSSFSALGTSQIMTVPFAFVADSALKGGGLSQVNVAAPLVGAGTNANPVKITDGGTANDILAWNGNAWAPAQLSVATGSGLTGAGSVSNPVKLINGSNINDVLVWSGSQWVSGSAPGDGWGTQFAVTDLTLAGGGTNANPLKISQQSATQGQTLKWNGTSWAPANDDVSFGGTLTTSPRISGNGNAGSPLDLAGQGANTGQVLKWNGSSWAPANDNGDTYTAASPLAINGSQIKLNNGNALNDALIWNGSQWVSAPVPGDGWGPQVALTDQTLSGNGKGGSELKIAQQGASTGQILKWNGSSWAPAADGGATYTASAPLAINNNNIALVNGTANNQVLKWNGSAWAPGTDDAGGAFTAGNGIAIANGVISNTVWNLTGTTAFRTDGVVGIGTANPGGKLEIKENTSITAPHLKLNESEADFARINFANTQSQHYWSIGGRPEGGGQEGRLNIFYSDGNQDMMSFAMDGQIGIGTVNPLFDTRIDVLSGRKYAGYFTSNFAANETTVLSGIYEGGGNFNAVGVYGEALPNLGFGYGGYFMGGNTGAFCVGDGGTFNGNYAIIGVYGESRDNPQSAATGSRIGTYGFAKGGQLSIGAYGSTDNTGVDNWAGYFEGRVRVVGNLVKSAGTFEIDHPLDPENKFLYHSFVESPDMMNVYNGNVVTDANGEALVQMPAYFQALNAEFRYQLTAIGAPAQAYVLKEIENNQFTIKADKPNVKISWQVTGVRIDPYAQKNRVQVEVDKKPHEKGQYKHPEVYGLSAERGLGASLKPAPTTVVTRKAVRKAVEALKNSSN